MFLRCLLLAIVINAAAEGIAFSITVVAVLIPFTVVVGVAIRLGGVIFTVRVGVSVVVTTGIATSAIIFIPLTIFVVIAILLLLVASTAGFCEFEWYKVRGRIRDLKQ